MKSSNRSENIKVRNYFIWRKSAEIAMRQYARGFGIFFSVISIIGNNFDTIKARLDVKESWIGLSREAVHIGILWIG